MDEKLARGFERQHIRNRLKEAEAEEAAARNVLRTAIGRLATGRVVANPVAMMAAWRSAINGPGVTLIQAGPYRRAVAFRPAWREALLDYKLITNDTVVEKVDEQFTEFTVLADGLEIDRKEMTSFCGAGALVADRHALHRWLQRQPSATAPGFEAALLARLPMATVCALVCSGLGADSVGVVMPLGDGLLIGQCLRRTSGMAVDEMPFGAWTHHRCGKLPETNPANLLGTGFGNRIGGEIFQGVTFFGPNELGRELREVRHRLLAWERDHADALGFDWLAESALANATMVREDYPAAASALAHLYASDLWQSAVLDRAKRALGRKVAA